MTERNGRKMKIKKMLALFLCLVSAQSLIACNDDDSKKDNDDDEKKVSVKEFENDDESISTNDDETGKIKVKESLIYDDRDVKMSVTDVYEDGGDIVFEILVENNSEKTISFRTQHFVVNGITLYGSFNPYDDVAAGEEAVFNLSFFRSDLERANIEKILTVEDGDFSMMIHEEYGQTMNFISFKIETLVDNYVQEIDDSGTVIYSYNGVELVCQKSSTKERSSGEITGKEITFFANNTSDRDYYFRMPVYSVNGIPVEGEVLFVSVERNSVGYEVCELRCEDVADDFNEEITSVTFVVELHDSTDTAIADMVAASDPITLDLTDSE